MKRLLLVALVIVVVVVGWMVSQRRHAATQGSGPLLPLASMVDAGPLGESGAAVDAKGRVWIWGEAIPEFFGASNKPTPRHEAVRVKGVDGAVMALLRADGSVLHFGGETSEMCEVRPGEPLELPFAVPGLRNIASVAVMRGEILAMGRDGSLWRWGDRSTDLDQPRTGCMEAAEQLLPPGSITALTATGLSAVAWLRKGGALAWGHDTVLNAGTKDLPRRWVDRQRVKGP